LDGTKAWNDAKSYCNDVYGTFSQYEKEIIESTGKTDTTSGYYAAADLTGEKLFLLSVSEVGEYLDTTDSRMPGEWWLRSLRTDDSNAGVVQYSGSLGNSDLSNNNLYGARPAFVLNRASVLFTSAAEGGKSSAAAGSGSFRTFKASSGTSDDRKLTILGSAKQQKFTANAETTSVNSGGSLSITYSNAMKGDGYYVSAMLTDSSGDVKGYASISPDSASGTWNMTLPTLTSGTYTLNVFSEQQNGNYQTDYASPMSKITLMVTGSTVTAHSVIVTPGANMKRTTGSGEESQTGLTGAMEDVVFIADDRYYFPENYTVASKNGISVTRNSYNQITVSGTPTADTELTLTSPTAKMSQNKPTTPTAVGCSTAANNDGKITGVTTDMEYTKDPDTTWNGITGTSVTGLTPGAYYVRYKATDTTLASEYKELTVAEYTAPMPVNIASAEVAGITDKTYTGKAITQSPTVVLDNKTLLNGTGYTLSYANNVNVGTATMTITGTGSYTGSIQKTFAIAQAGQTITASDITKTTADAPFSIGASTSGDGQLSYTSSSASVVTVDGNGNATVKGAGNATITITAAETANYKSATKTINVTVTAANQAPSPAPINKSIASATVSDISNKTYTGKAITQSPTVVLDNKTLQNGTDYTLSYANNVNAGTATMTITGTGSYAGSLQNTFDIAKAEQTITASDITKTTADAAFSIGASASGNGQLTYKSGNTGVVIVDGNGKVTIKGAGTTMITIIASETANYNKATKTIIVTVTSNSTSKKSIAKAKITGIKDKTYTGEALTQKLTVKLDKKKLKAGTDYTVSYKNNVKVGTAKITITGKGNYKGTVTAKFKIKKAANTLNVKAQKTAYNIAYSKLSKKDQGIKETKIYKVVKKGKGKLSYALSSVKLDKKNVKNGFAVDKKTGKLTVKKGLKKGTYNVEINVTAAGDKNHKKGTKKLAITVKVK
jgi:hypothetical protein